MQSQEIITNLAGNPAKQQYVKTKGMAARTDKPAHVFLPFTDDFSGKSIYPNQNLWSDRYAFINSTYAINSKTVGVATLDALNDSGFIYSHASHSEFIADHLTSNHIRLDSVRVGAVLTPVKISDSLYLSFYYQPEGIGDKPEPHDSLVLEFYAPRDTAWYRIWSTPGQSYQQFFDTHNQDFKRVMVPVTDSLKYFHKDFRFRFLNYASVANTYEPSWAGNVDHWHIDYVYLNKGRNMHDTIYEDVAFTKKPSSLIQGYQSVPWQHYLASTSSFPAITEVGLPYANLSDITKNVSRNFYIMDLADSSEVFSYSGGNLNLLPHSDETFNISVSPSFSSAATDTALFEIKGIINTTPDINRRNDTVRYIQRFHNFFAYDDGSAESGYGLTPAGSKLAYRFNAHKADTLKAVKMFFNHTYENASQQNFYLTIWTGNNEPSQIIYEQANVRPEFEDDLNKFHVYFLDTPLVVNGFFYVGWRQTTNDNLNIGFDRNTNSSDHIFYNVDGTWRKSMYEGSLMIRPMFGDLFNVGINEKISQPQTSFSAYPNPLRTNILNIRSTPEQDFSHSNYYFYFYDILGALVFKTKLSQQIHISSQLSNGIYFYVIQCSNENIPLKKDKIILQR